ncbi:hypothetical protein BTJ45_05079 [Bacillus mycoides]|nr:hypothetical protein BTJ45_05079 [Bacillus mycoides]
MIAFSYYFKKTFQYIVEKDSGPRIFFRLYLIIKQELS